MAAHCSVTLLRCACLRTLQLLMLTLFLPLRSHFFFAAGVKLTVEQFLNVVSAPGRMDDMRHSDAVYNYLEAMLKAYSTDADAETLCKVSRVAAAQEGLREYGMCAYWCAHIYCPIATCYRVAGLARAGLLGVPAAPRD